MITSHSYNHIVLIYSKLDYELSAEIGSTNVDGRWPWPVGSTVEGR